MHIEAWTDIRNEDYKTGWEQARAIAWNVAKWSGNMKDPNMPLERFWRFEWDEPTNEIDLFEASRLYSLKLMAKNGGRKQPDS